MSLGCFERDGPAGIIFRYDMRYVVAAVTCDVCIPKTLKLTYTMFGKVLKPLNFFFQQGL